MNNKDEMIQIILTLHRDGSVEKGIYLEPGITPAVAGMLALGMLAHAQTTLKVEVVA